MTALSSITHNGGLNFGTESKLRREKFVQPDGSVEDVPILSGNGIRGKLRDTGMTHMLRELGYGDEGDRLSLPAFHFLMSGGSLTSTGKKALQISEAKSLKGLIPLVGIFGGGLGNCLLPGILKCGKAIPICSETKHVLPKDFQSDFQSDRSCWDFLQQELYTRRDDFKDDRKRQVLDEKTRLLLGRPESKAKPADKSDGATAQMMYSVETIAAGTRLYWQVVLDDPTPLEMDAFMTCLAQFSAMPYVGGKSAIGMGEVKIDFGSWIKIDSRAIVDTSEVWMSDGSLYAKHLLGNKMGIRKALGAIC